MKLLPVVALVFSAPLVLSACSPKVGSDQWCADTKAKPSGDLTANEIKNYAKHCLIDFGTDWCADMKAKPKGDWTANEAADYAKHCLFD